jgi:hypothetical protein
MLFAGVALICSCALIAAWLFTSSGHRVAVLAVARNVPVGSVITSADLAQVTVSGTGLATIGAGQAGRVAGHAAAVSLRAGQLLIPADLTTAAVPAAGQMKVPVPLRAQDLPASGLTPGDHVLVLGTPGSGGQAGTGQAGHGPLLAGVPASVYQVSAPDQAGYVTVDLLVAAADGPVIIRQASTGQIALAVTAPGG